MPPEAECRVVATERRRNAGRNAAQCARGQQRAELTMRAELFNRRFVRRFEKASAEYQECRGPLQSFGAHPLLGLLVLHPMKVQPIEPNPARENEEAVDGLASARVTRDRRR